MIDSAQHAGAAGVVAAGRYLHWGVVQISLANLLIIAIMVAVFVAALLVPFPGAHRRDEDVARERSDVER